MHIEFKALRSCLDDAPLLGSPRYYTVVQVAPGESRGSGVQSLLDWLSYNRYKVRHQNIYPIQPTSNPREPAPNPRELRWSPNNLNSIIMLDAMTAYFEPGYDRLLLFSGSREMIPLCDVLRERNVQVDIMSSIEYDLIDSDLRRSCDNFFEFTEYANQFWRERPPELS